MEPSKLPPKSSSSSLTSSTVSSGSATGNPRNKVALSPGHSLMDWIRLGNSGKDLTGVGGKRLDVSEEELAAHSTSDNTWIAIRGLVYNITPYLNFHPGGIPEMMRGAGKDGTSLFNEIHPWVNYESILQKCLVGRLVKGNKAAATREQFDEAFFGKPLAPPSEPCTIDVKAVSNIKMDWCQTCDKVCILLFTQVSSPQIVVTMKPEYHVRVLLRVKKKLHIFAFKLQNKVLWPCMIHVNTHIGRVSIEFEKKTEGLWEQFGTCDKDNCTIASDPDEIETYHNVKIISIIPLTPNTSNFIFKFTEQVCVWVPLGHDIRIRAIIEEVDTAKQYTPIPPHLPHNTPPKHWHHDYLCCMVKLYPTGALTPWLFSKQEGDIIEIGGISGVFDIHKLSYVSDLYLIAAGSGISPMIKLIIWGLQEKQQVKKISLLYLNKSEEDIIWRKEFDKVASKESRFTVTYGLSQPNEEWKGLRGRIDGATIDNFIPVGLPVDTECPSKFYIVACGPIPFTELVKSLLDDRGYSYCSFCFIG